MINSSTKDYTTKITITLCILSVCFFTSCSSKKGLGLNGGLGNDPYGTGANGGAYGSGINSEDIALQNRGLNEGAIPYAQDGEFFKDINFGYDSSAINANNRNMLQQNARVLNEDPSIQVEIEGHCDSRGTSEYNLALGAQRARSVREILISYGVDANRLSTVSYGEEIPLNPSESEAAFAQNRRAHFALFRSNNR